MPDKHFSISSSLILAFFSKAVAFSAVMSMARNKDTVEKMLFWLTPANAVVAAGILQIGAAPNMRERER